MLQKWSRPQCTCTMWPPKSSRKIFGASVRQLQCEPNVEGQLRLKSALRMAAQGRTKLLNLSALLVLAALELRRGSWRSSPGPQTLKYKALVSALHRLRLVRVARSGEVPVRRTWSRAGSERLREAPGKLGAPSSSLALAQATS